MRADRVLAIAKKNLRALKHDRRTVGFLVVMPLLMISIFGYTFGGNVTGLKVYIVNLDGAPANQSFSLKIVGFLEESDTFDIVKTYGPEDASADPVAVARDKVKDADIWAAIVFNETFSQDVAEITSSSGGQPAVVTAIIDGTNPNVVQTIANELQTTVRLVLGAQAFIPPIVVATDLVYGQGAEFIDFFAPGVMGLAAMMVTFMLSIISFVHERSASTLDRLLSTPATEGEIVAGYALAFGLVGLVQSCVILVTAVLLFQIQIQGSALLVLGVILLFAIGTQGLGFLLSSIAKNEFQAIQFMPLILFPSILLSGVFWPIEAVPVLLRPISYFIPLTYAVEACRSVMIRGWGPGDIWFQLVVLALFATIMLALSTYGLKRRG
ncbi:MAG: ABC transporter permease [Thermoplasmata archaeon]